MDRAATIKIGEQEYNLLLSTRATKEIAQKFGGLGNLGDKLSKAGSFEEMLDDLIWLIVTLANQGIMAEHYREGTAKKPLLSIDAVEILTTPGDLVTYRDAIAEALLKGTKREVESEEPKNA